MSVIAGMRAKRVIAAALVALALAFGGSLGIDPTRGGGEAAAAGRPWVCDPVEPTECAPFPE